MCVCKFCCDKDDPHNKTKQNNLKKQNQKNNQKKGKTFIENGWRAVAITKRGCGTSVNVPLKSAKHWCLKSLNDMEQALDLLHQRYPQSKMVLIG